MLKAVHAPAKVGGRREWAIVGVSWAVNQSERERERERVKERERVRGRDSMKEKARSEGSD